MVRNWTCNGFFNGRNCFCGCTISHNATDPRELACGYGNVNCHYSYSQGDANSHAGVHSGTEPYTRRYSRTGVRNRGTNKHANSNSEGEPPDKTPQPTPHR